MKKNLSKTQQKNAAHAAADLTERLLSLREEEIVTLPLSETILEAISVARQITAHGGQKRQRKYVAQLLRDCDIEPIELSLQPILAAKADEANEFKLVEQWRDRLLVEGVNTIESFLQTYTCAGREEITNLVQQARVEKQMSKPPRAQRELFRAIKKCIADHNRQ